MAKGLGLTRAEPARFSRCRASHSAARFPGPGRRPRSIESIRALGLSWRRNRVDGAHSRPVTLPSRSARERAIRVADPRTRRATGNDGPAQPSRIPEPMRFQTRSLEVGGRGAFASERTFGLPADRAGVSAHIHVIDVETTGLDSEEDRIVEIAAVTVALEPRPHVEALSLDTLVNPGIPIGPVAQSIHHIGDAMVTDAPRYEALFPASRRARREWTLRSASRRFRPGFHAQFADPGSAPSVSHAISGRGPEPRQPGAALLPSGSRSRSVSRARGASFPTGPRATRW